MNTLKQPIKYLAAFSLLFAIFLTHPTAEIKAQPYQVAVGLRAGGTSGLTIKGFTSPATAVEAIIAGYPHGPAITLLGETHAGLTENIAVYLGGGGHLRSSRWNNYGDDRPLLFFGYAPYNEGEWGWGLDAVLGIEAKIPAIPLAFSLDTKPFIDFTSENRVFVGYDVGLGAKLAF